MTDIAATKSVKDPSGEVPEAKTDKSARSKLSREPGLRVIVQNPPSINVGGGRSRSLYQVTLQSSDTRELYDNVDLLQQKMKELPSIQDVNSDLQLNSPQVNVDINRKQASALGVSVSQIQSALGDAFGSRQLSTIYTPTNEYQVILEIKPENQLDPNVLQQLYISSATGKLVPLSTVATVSKDVGPVLINHLGQLPSATVSFNLRPGVSLSQATDQVFALAKKSLPATITVSFQAVPRSSRHLCKT